MLRTRSALKDQCFLINIMYFKSSCEQIEQKQKLLQPRYFSPLEGDVHSRHFPQTQIKDLNLINKFCFIQNGTKPSENVIYVIYFSQ